MKTLVLALILAFVSVSAHAEISKSGMELCTSMSNNAETIMEARQVGVPIEKLMEITMDKSGYAPVRELYQRMLVMAYERPAFSTWEYRNEAVKEFKNTMFLVCAKILM